MIVSMQYGGMEIVMRKCKIEMYKRLNKLAKSSGCVIFGGSEDVDIPIAELKQAFGLEENYYNRSVSGLTLSEAADTYRECAANLEPETVFLHMGEEELKSLAVGTEKLAKDYRMLINAVREGDKKRRVVIVSMKNYDANAETTEFNKQLKYIAESEHCVYCDISEKKTWSPKRTAETMSFIHDIGFVHPLNIKKPVSDLVRMIFCCS